ncbi:MAG: Lrp/AsnC family transcriptional regulator [Burkholderiales bacterium]|nr:Lrp/AsnC family transcriptional regulator [Burkholderiales bacterium]
MKKKEISIDAYGLRLLDELQRDSRQTIQQLAERVGLSATPCWKRIREMEEAGVIRGYTALVDREQVGLGLSVLVEVNLGQHSEDLVQRFERAVQVCPHIVGCVSTTGQSDYVLTVHCSGIQRYEQLLHETLFKLPGVTHLRSSIVLKEVKAQTPLVLAGEGAAPRRRVRKAG